MNGEKPRDLRERTTEFALRVIRMAAALPKSVQAQVLGRQVLRSGTSVGANYREAQRARSKAEFVAKCGDCLKEIDETAYWLELLERGGVVRAEELAPLREETDQLVAIFVTVVKRAKEEKQEGRRRKGEGSIGDDEGCAPGD